MESLQKMGIDLKNPDSLSNYNELKELMNSNELIIEDQGKSFE